MTILPQLERDLFNAAEERLRPDATAPDRGSGSPPSSFGARLGQAAASLSLLVSVAVAIAIAVVAVAVLGHGHHASQSTSASGPSRDSPRAELIRTLGVLRRPQTKADLNGIERIDHELKARPKQMGSILEQWGYANLDRRLARLVNIPAWRAKVLIAPTRFRPSPASGPRPERVQLAWWIGTAPGSFVPSGQPGGTSVGALLAHGLSAGCLVPGLHYMNGVVRGPDVMDCVLLVPDGVASIKVGRFTKWPAHDTIAGLSNKALNAALASIHGTSAVHDNIVAFHLPIPIYTGRPQWAHWPGPGPAPRFWFPGIAATAQDTWFDARGHVVRRTTTEIDLTVRVQVPRTASH